MKDKTSEVKFEQVIDVLAAELKNKLPDVNQLTTAKLEHILGLYALIFNKNFVRWLTITYLNCKSPVARKICAEDLYCEVNENHQGLLNDLYNPLIIKYNLSLSQFPQLQTICHMIGEMIEMPCDGLMCLMVLETMSIIFMPWMNLATQKCNIADNGFLRIHIVADIEHARVFGDALSCERKYYPNHYFINEINDKYLGSNSLRLTYNLLCKIFLDSETSAHKDLGHAMLNT